MSYKKNVSSDKDFLFGGTGGGAVKKKKSAIPKSEAGPALTTSKGYSYGREKNGSSTKAGISDEVKAAKIKEAEDYRDKAKKSMQKGLFSKPDPLAASTYYKRAADAYQAAGEQRLEQMYRMSSADCQQRVGAWATAATEYSRAAELIQEADYETDEMKREIGRKLYLDAAEAWRQANDPGKAAISTVQAAKALMWGNESRFLPKNALEAIEEAVETFVPDPLNPYCRYRQTGRSVFVDPESDEIAENPTPEVMELAKTQLVTRAYAHEPLQEVVYLFLDYSEYASALYAAGATTVLLEGNGVSTLSLSRAFVAETIITLAMGDPVAAEEHFLNRHVQKSFYLTSRECKLGEELFRAVKNRDKDELEMARDMKGANRSGIGNLPNALKDVLSNIRVSGVARKGDSDIAAKTSYENEKRTRQSGDSDKAMANNDTQCLWPLADLTAAKMGYEVDPEDVGQIDASALEDELNALDFGEDEESDLDDDDIDLR